MDNDDLRLQIALLDSLSNAMLNTVHNQPLIEKLMKQVLDKISKHYET